MSAKRILIYAGAGLAIGSAGYYIYAKSNIDFKPNGITVAGLPNNGILSLGVQFLVTSRLPVDITVTSLAFNVISAGNIVAVGQLNSALLIPKNTQLPIQINVDIDTNKLATSFAAGLISSLTGGSGLTANIQGNCDVVVNVPFINLFTIGIPFSENYALSL